MHDFIGRAYGDVYGVDVRVFDIANGMIDFAETGDWHPAIDATCDVVRQYLKVRDEIEGERAFAADILVVVMREGDVFPPGRDGNGGSAWILVVNPKFLEAVMPLIAS